jgi:hypothetical protein
MPSTSPRYGIPNFEMLKTWIGRPPEDDGPFWALNLMKYRAVAAYDDGRDTTVSGREADDAYAPLGPLAAVGAMVAFHGDIERQRGSAPEWDRVGIVRYPTRRAFFEMQQRDDFKRQHTHKEAGMEFTIVMSCLPDAAMPPVAIPPGVALVLRVARVGAGQDLPAVPGAVRVATFDVEGVIVGDERTWSRVAFDAAPTSQVVGALLDSTDGVDEMFAMALAKPGIEAITESIRTAPADDRNAMPS